MRPERDAVVELRAAAPPGCKGPKGTGGFIPVPQGDVLPSVASDRSLSAFCDEGLKGTDLHLDLGKRASRQRVWWVNRQCKWGARCDVNIDTTIS